MAGARNPEVDAFVAEAYAFLCSPDASDIGKVRRGVLHCDRLWWAALRCVVH